MRKLLAAIFVLGVSTMAVMSAPNPSRDARRARAAQAEKQGNYKDAYDDFRLLALDPENDPALAGTDLKGAIRALARLGRNQEVDELRDAVVDAHKNQWRTLMAAAQTLAEGEHYGFIISGKFQRGWNRGGGRYVGSAARDRVRALQWLTQAQELARDDPDRVAAADLHFEFARVLLGGQSGWRLQTLTDLKELPDYEEGYQRGEGAIGAPVGDDGQPVYYHAPKTYGAATNDGERWRWLLARGSELDPGRRDEARSLIAGFCQSQFGVQTMASEGLPTGPTNDDGRENESGPYALGTLNDDETIARLATGTKRLRLPDEFNPIKIYREIGEGPQSSFGAAALDALGQIFEDRRQYPKAAATWERAIARYGPGPQGYRKERLRQIVGNWGEFQPEGTQPAGTAATIAFRYRNGKKVHLEAHEITIPKLLDEVKAYLKGLQNNNQFDWNKINLANIGFRVVNQHEQQLLGARVAAWDVALDPRPAHRDRRITLETPLKKAGAYFLTARMDDGNTSRIILWVADSAIVKKPTPSGMLYFVADAVSGEPVARANVEFFGFRWEAVNPGRGVHRAVTRDFTQATDANGLIVLNDKVLTPDSQWLAIARTDAGRLAFLGFSQVWHPNANDAVEDQVKSFVITDRPAYRPGQPVKFKFWVRHARYAGGDEPATARRPFQAKINNPKGETIFERQYTTDDYGGFDGEFALPRDATLGSYVLFIDGLQGQSFRVEEYKKPEFEVTVDAPAEPVKLGEKVTVVVHAKYLFGGPVKDAKVVYKVTRTRHDADWFPAGPWDWLYGSGYGWVARNYAWYPGWGSWGWTVSQRQPGMHFGFEPPEIVAQDEAAIGPDGTVAIKIDTGPALANHPDMDHKYEVTAEVVDASRRTIVGSGSVLVARKPFRVYVWLDRAYYRTGQQVEAHIQAQSLDRKPIRGKGKAELREVHYDGNAPVEKVVETWALDTDDAGRARLTLQAAKAGQYRLAYSLTDAQGRSAEGAYVFIVRGDGFDGKAFRFNDLELVPDKREYTPGDTVRLMVNTNRPGGTVVLFVRAVNGAVLPTKVLRLTGKSTVHEIGVTQQDMPNFFVEALTVSNGKVHDEFTEVIVPPQKKTLNVEVAPSQESYKPGAPAKVRVKLSDEAGKPFVGSAVLTMYDKALEYIAGGTNVPEIRSFFWKWRRAHQPQRETNLDLACGNLVADVKDVMNSLGVFGDEAVWDKNDENLAAFEPTSGPARGFGGGRLVERGMTRTESDMGRFHKTAPAPMAAAPARADGAVVMSADVAPCAAEAQPIIRRDFADSAFWAPTLTTDSQGLAEVTLKMPENLTGWKLRAWGMGTDTQVGQGEAEVVTAKNLLIRIQAPRFFVQYDEVVLSANIHNELKTDKDVRAVLELDGKVIEPLEALSRTVRVKAGGEQRVDWRVRVTAEGEAVVRMKALTDEESDAAEMRFPALVHGLPKTESFAGSVRPEANAAKITFRVPDARRPADSRLEIRYSPTLAGAMVDAIPYLADYPYGCTEQTLNRFLPTVIAQGVLRRMGVDLKALREQRNNLNAQEIGDPAQRAAQWQRSPRNPVFDEDEVRTMVREGLKDLTAMQLSSGAWGWFSGFGEHPDAHITALVVHGLQTARRNDVALEPGIYERAVDWLKGYQAEQVRRLRNAAAKVEPSKARADNLDAFVFMVLNDADVLDRDMLAFLERDRPHLSVYGLTLFGLALEKLGQKDALAQVLHNIEQYLVKDPENQTAYLRLPQNTPWWFWFGSETETQAYYLELLTRTDPKGETAPALVKYLLNNRKHATYWNSTRDTALCIEAMADYLKASGEDRPEMVLSISLDGKPRKQVKINPANLFQFDNTLVLTGEEITAGEHTLEIQREGRGPVYFNAYLSYFTLEDPIRGTGLEIKVSRKLYRVHPETRTEHVAGARGQVVDQKQSREPREALKDLSALKSGDLVEVELEIESKNDYEYLLFEDMKAAGFEPIDVRSGYNGNDLGAYMELRDQKVCFFVRTLARGRHSVRYRLRAEVPGKFSVLPTVGYGMYAPELRANSDEAKVAIED
ncbi:MAG: MG2 domain-containing protein [Isosphaeraceae bacterium]|nr:MG2 domain-containing protein [Isosphaeraceae bacterium]